MQPLAQVGTSLLHAHTNISTAISLSIFDESENEISIHADINQPIEFFIPRDPILIFPPMTEQNVTSNYLEQSFHLNSINMSQFTINSNITVSLHFEIQPFDSSLAYVFIYKFDGVPHLNSTINSTDGWALFCPSSEYLFYSSLI